MIFLRTQEVRDFGLEIDLSGPTQFPNDILRAVAPAFENLFSPAVAYRATGVILCKLTEAYYGQLDLFGEAIRMQRLSNLYERVDTLRDKYGKHTVFLGASFLAHRSAQHDGERGHLPGETTRKHLGIPMFMGEVTGAHPRLSLPYPWLSVFTSDLRVLFLVILSGAGTVSMSY